MPKEAFSTSKKMQQKLKERGYRSQERTPMIYPGLHTRTLWQACNRNRLREIERFTVEMQNAVLISSMEHIHVLGEGASDTSCHVQECKHAVALQQSGHDSRSSLLDGLLPVHSHTCLQ